MDELHAVAPAPLNRVGVSEYVDVLACARDSGECHEDVEDAVLGDIIAMASLASAPCLPRKMARRVHEHACNARWWERLKKEQANTAIADANYTRSLKATAIIACGSDAGLDQRYFRFQLSAQELVQFRVHAAVQHTRRGRRVGSRA